MIGGFEKHKKIQDEWSGDAISGQLGLDIPIPIPELLGLASVSFGIAPFSTAIKDTNTPNFEAYGADIYLGLSGGTGIWDLPIAVGGFTIRATMLPSYYVKYDDLDQMLHDIRTGKDSPTVMFPQVRDWFADQAILWNSIQGADSQ